MIVRVSRKLFPALSPGSERNLRDTLRSESVGGVLLLIATAAALIWCNSPWADGYDAVRDTVIGPSALHLDLTIGQWASDGLLAIFFFVVGLELKREFVDGELRRPATAIIPIVAAVGGMIVPALIYVVVNLQEGGALVGWATPTATDIAFAVAILAVVNTHLPNSLRAFLLTLAVVDDLLAITVIAIFYTSEIDFAMLAASAAAIAVFALAVRSKAARWWVLLPLGLIAWALMHASGIHATIAGVLLGFMVPALARKDEHESLAERYEHLWRPISAGFAVPVFALFAAGVPLGAQMFADAASDPVAQGVALALVIGKPLGILGATYLVARFTKAQLDQGLAWRDVLGVAALGGIGFTVSLLIGELAFGAGSPHDDHVKVAILVASAASALLGAAILRRRNTYYRHRRVIPDTLAEG